MKNITLYICTIIALFLLSSQATRGKEFILELPVDCIVGEDCWLINYVDNDPSEAWQDFSGENRTYDGHRGTDIAVRNIEHMQNGVAVLAAADGRVVAVRDGVPDVNALINRQPDLKKIACGNRVAILHANSYITDYCHMKQNSILVKKGDRVTAGQKIGKIGLSGLTEFPHLHFGLMRQNTFLDPFTGQHRYQGKKPFHSLWEPQVMKRFQNTVRILYNAGISDKIPDWVSIRGPKKTNFTSHAELLIVWADLIHAKKNDILEFLILGPDNKPFLNKQMIIDEPHVKKYLFAGKKPPIGGYPKGSYKGVVKFSRPFTHIKNSQAVEFSIF